jgi:Zn-dependent M28 family amino/carboxypeptidase
LYAAAVVPGEKDNSGAVVITAHYDAIYQGADDNGSGVSAVLELARVFASAHPGKQLYFVFTNGEEYGNIGVYAFINDLLKQGKVVPRDSFICNIDTVGFSQANADLGARELGIYSVGEEYLSEYFEMVDYDARDFSVNLKAGMLAPGSSQSDACQWSKYGFPLAVTLSTSHPGQNAMLHTKSDTVRYIDPVLVRDVAVFVADFIGRQAELMIFPVRIMTPMCRCV